MRRLDHRRRPGTYSPHGRQPLQSPPITLDEIAAGAGISLRQLRTYYTSVTAIEADLADQGAPPAPPASPTTRRR